MNKKRIINNLLGVLLTNLGAYIILSCLVFLLLSAGKSPDEFHVTDLSDVLKITLGVLVFCNIAVSGIVIAVYGIEKIN